jgi:hypothetical protein
MVNSLKDVLGRALLLITWALHLVIECSVIDHPHMHVFCKLQLSGCMEQGHGIDLHLHLDLDLDLDLVFLVYMYRKRTSGKQLSTVQDSKTAVNAILYEITVALERHACHPNLGDRPSDNNKLVKRALLRVC